MSGPAALACALRPKSPARGKGLACAHFQAIEYSAAFECCRQERASV
jgi:hypothetical protein